jgi:pimeloyl-ACP methyl ester carboxylesterase
MNHFYPGMGATASMYGTQWREELQGQFHDWPEWGGERTLSDFAKRLIEEHHIEVGDTVVGTSLGGMIACEIANQIELERIVLIGSARSNNEINKVLSILHPLIDLTPVAFIQMSSGKLPSDLTQMFHQSDPAFIRNMSKAIFSWNGLVCDVDVLRIHGEKDVVIPCPEEVEQVVDGGHLIVMTHPIECIQCIKANLKE